MSPIDVAHAALLEAGRPDLAERIQWFYEDPNDLNAGGYIEVWDTDIDPLSHVDLILVNNAQAIAGMAP